MVKYLLLLVFCVLFGLTTASGQINYSNKIRLNTDWEFVKGDLGNVWEAVRPIPKPDAPESLPLWEKVTLPHCFNAEDAVVANLNYYQGPGWYRTNLKIENPYQNGRTLLHFEGAGQKTQVYIFTKKVATHVGGYDEWSVDITAAVTEFLHSSDAKRFNGKVPVIIRCDNSRDSQMIPSSMSDFNVYGGIYRYLNLVYTPSFAFSNIQTIASLDFGKKEGRLIIKTDFNNQSIPLEASVEIKIYSPEGKLIKEESKKIKDLADRELLSLTIKNPSYWTPETPNLYRCELILNSQTGIMTCSETFGFRHFEFVKKGPFLLNGKRLLLKGTHRHEDHAGVAAAMTEDMIVREMQLIKDMGVNFIRLGHYQQSRIVLDQCDQLGILVWEEIPWCRGGLGNETYQEQAKQMLINMIDQHRNHPSIILWGLGNENDWPGDFPEFDKEKIRVFMGELNNLSHSRDNSRLTCIRRCDFCKDIVDVYSPSIWAGWYSGKYTDYQRMSHENMEKVDHFLHVEWGGDSHAGRHAENPNEGKPNPVVNGDWSETYICDLVDWHLKEQENMPWLTGTAYWPFKDFSTPIRPENPIPYMNQKGVVSRDFAPKEIYYVFQSYWTEKPMIHIYGHTWPVRWGDENEMKQLKVYSNCDKVELFLNGKSLGIEKRNSQDFPAAGLHWDTPFKKGNNEVKVVGYKGKEIIKDEITFEYQTAKWGKEAQLTLSVLKENNDYAIIEAKLLDANNNLCLTSRKFIYFESAGDGELIINQGTTTGSQKIQVYNGRAQITLKKKGKKSIVVCKCEDIPSGLIEIAK